MRCYNLSSTRRGETGCFILVIAYRKERACYDTAENANGRGRAIRRSPPRAGPSRPVNCKGRRSYFVLVPRYRGFDQVHGRHEGHWRSGSSESADTSSHHPAPATRCSPCLHQPGFVRSGRIGRARLDKEFKTLLRGSLRDIISICLDPHRDLCLPMM